MQRWYKYKGHTLTNGDGGILDVSKEHQSPEYSPYLLFDGKGSVAIDMKNIPKSSYKPLNGDYVAGFMLVNRINDAEESGELLKIEIKDR